ncbi:MAG: hypothetical protein RKO66_10415 [Candidatus Contendobacter sp.]|nr:hypothetical protein [Candidatus Contendobacter sp.]MDS4058572.1 hypothetical protein [Candidatus Contendobacter sp.]
MPRKLGRGDRDETTYQNRAAGVRRVSAPMPAKLAPPRLHDIAERERLFSLLDERRKHPLVWIAGPPGAGKTMLVASYLHARGLPGIWYQVDAGDTDPATLFYYLRQALPSPRQARLPLLTPEYLPDLSGFARRFFRELFARLPRPAALVLDNFHEASAATSFRVIWHEAAAQIPEGANLLVIGRQDPPAEYARLHLSELLTMLDAQDLRLTPEETRTIVALRAHLPETAVRALHERSKGWIAGLTLLLEHARGTAVPSDAAEQASPQALFDYFATEIFASAADDIRHLWLRTAYLPRFTAPTARVLSERETADRLLCWTRSTAKVISSTGAAYRPLFTNITLCFRRSCGIGSNKTTPPSNAESWSALRPRRSKPRAMPTRLLTCLSKSRTGKPPWDRFSHAPPNCSARAVGGPCKAGSTPCHERRSKPSLGCCSGPALVRPRPRRARVARRWSALTTVSARSMTNLAKH